MRTIALTWIFLLGVIPLPVALAQSLSLSGIVHDPSSAGVPNALVTLRKGTEAQTTRTNINGGFSFDKLSAGTYEVQVQQEGFKIARARTAAGNRNARPLD